MLMHKGKFNALQSEVENPKHGKEEGQAVPLVALSPKAFNPLSTVTI